jgi:hypothetical protein
LRYARKSKYFYFCLYFRLKEPLTPTLFIFLRIDAGGTLEIAAEIGGGGESELEGCILDRLLGMRV